MLRSSGPSGSGGKSLQVVLAWADAINSDGRLNGINADIIIRPDHIIVSRAGVKPEGNAIENECLKRLSIGGQLSITPSNAQAIKDCRMHAMAAGATSTAHAVIFPLMPAPRKCTEAKLVNGLYRICATLLQISADKLSLEYEEDSNHNGTFYGHRARFEVTLQRDFTIPLGRILGCKVNIVAAYSFNPKEPSKLIPLDNPKQEQCTASSA